MDYTLLRLEFFGAGGHYLDKLKEVAVLLKIVDLRLHRHIVELFTHVHLLNEVVNLEVQSFAVLLKFLKVYKVLLNFRVEVFAGCELQHE